MAIIAQTPGPAHPIRRTGDRRAQPRRRPTVRGGEGRPIIAHASNIVPCAGPDSPHAFDTIAVLPRYGNLDAKCPVCHGHGQWNTEIDLVSFRSKRAICDRCDGAGWIETGNDPVGRADIVMTPEGYPAWTVAFDPKAAGD